jgi:hypothetical protein
MGLQGYLDQPTSAFSNIILVFPDMTPFDTLKTKIYKILNGRQFHISKLKATFKYLK